jgi:hypothetical protein
MCCDRVSEGSAGARAQARLLLLLAWSIMPVYFELVSPLENIVEDLKSLPPARLEVAADFVQRLKRITEEERQAVLARTPGALTAEESRRVGASDRGRLRGN